MHAKVEIGRIHLFGVVRVEPNRELGVGNESSKKVAIAATEAKLLLLAAHVIWAKSAVLLHSHEGNVEVTDIILRIDNVISWGRKNNVEDRVFSAGHVCRGQRFSLGVKAALLCRVLVDV